MTAPERNYSQYRENTINASKPEELTMMLYNGLIKFIIRAKEEINEKNYEAAHNTLVRCQDIVFEFQFTLNMEYDMSKNLMRLYDYMYNRLIEANAKKDTEILDEVLGFASELRDTWLEVLKQVKEQQDSDESAAADEADKSGMVNLSLNTSESNNTETASGESVLGTGEDSGQQDVVDEETKVRQAAAAIARLHPEAVIKDVGNQKAIEISGASVQLGGGGPKVPSTKALYSKNARPVGAVAALPKTTADKAENSANGVKTQFIQRAANRPMSGNVSIVQEDVSSVSMTVPSQAPQAVGGVVSFGGSTAAKVFTNPLNKINPSIAAQYAKVSKSKDMPQENISISSK